MSTTPDSEFSTEAIDKLLRHFQKPEHSGVQYRRNERRDLPSVKLPTEYVVRRNRFSTQPMNRPPKVCLGYGIFLKDLFLYACRHPEIFKEASTSPADLLAVKGRQMRKCYLKGICLLARIHLSTVLQCPRLLDVPIQSASVDYELVIALYDNYGIYRYEEKRRQKELLARLKEELEIPEAEQAMWFIEN
ncbi:hypothetical protein CONPUDRAFT_164288 [Coniophora puteana RWD-64-598 SS2]|uniref:Uncharacterized protein n=1 Tax=Coniophora puteana (strain RWD-64-598) TaxID=741705 RepID=A0A5M3MWG0_CONPW|nr:uncharacterized protein CONPUDRAFT_164288 [Coniophora puteana RWD-64-598 SS2]EIW83327.1 hypothetical protein CONPUDRAFT_164288 [Coniophora puteana RWD-64-598 SS2]